MEMVPWQNVLWPYTDILFWISVEHTWLNAISVNLYQQLQGTFSFLFQHKGMCKLFLICFAKISPVKSAFPCCQFGVSLADLAWSRLWSVHVIPSNCQSGGDSKLHQNGNNKQPGDRYI